LFFVVVVFFAAFFSVGYVVGFGHGESSRPTPDLAEAPPPAPAQEEVRLPDSLLMPSEEEPPEPAPAPVGAEPKESPRVVETPTPAKPAPAPSSAAQQKTAVTPPAAAKTPAPRPTAPPTPRPAAPNSAAAAGYNVQVSAVRVAADANNVAGNLRQKGYPAHVEPDHGDGWHRVLVGPFASREAAEESRKRLAADGFKPLLRAP
jgi:cell division septation protein DedD